MQSGRSHHDQAVNELAGMRILANCEQYNTSLGNTTRHDKLFELSKAVCQAQRLSRRTGSIFLDIEKAYVMNAPALLLRWISSFLRDRTVKVRILGHTSWEITINYGVPQGRPISPLLFLLYISKLPKLLR